MPTHDDEIQNALDKYSEHPSIKFIKTKCKKGEIFEFCRITVEEIYQEIQDLDDSKKVSGNIPIKVLKLAVAQCAPIF